ncbi:MAG: cytochrome c peroxidase, partial [Salinisphaeraceae bacterium]|nr:cytochrome c peroxidase [Salinisphaeraceae bacterium]
MYRTQNRTKTAYKGIQALSLLAVLILGGCGQTHSEPNVFRADASTQASAAIQNQGQALFEQATFDGNGRSCASCHSGELRSITPEQAQSRFAENPKDPLFGHDAADDFGRAENAVVCVPVEADKACTSTGWAELCDVEVKNQVTKECRRSFRRFLTHATIKVAIDLHPNVNVLGFDKQVLVSRGVPTTVDIGLESVFMSDGRAPTLQAQAADAAQGHAQVSAFAGQQIEAIVAFESSEFSSKELLAFASGGAAPELPAGNTESEKRGREFFITPEKRGKRGFCGMCHSGPMLNEVGVDILIRGPFAGKTPGLEARIGDRFIT